jgi:poly-gamma-glutamate synthesis protein (capsule biosynthesis protein)
MRAAIEIPAGFTPVTERQDADLWLQPGLPPPDAFAVTYWTYALVAPFPTVVDEVSEEELDRVLKDSSPAPMNGAPLLLSGETLAFFEQWWGVAGLTGARVVLPELILEAAWQSQPSWAIVPFAEVEPRWKVLRVGDQSPLDKDFDPSSYPLSVPVSLRANPDRAIAAGAPLDAFHLPTNRDPERLTVLVMTGVTALSRQTAEVMEARGVTYPGKDIHSWLADADLTHISNEVSFTADCPVATAERRDMRFCSRPEYIELLEFIGTDFVELTGNHMLDWGSRPMLDTLAMYQERGWGVYGGGANLAKARQPLLIEHNGNRLAFLGCSPAGPEGVWALDNRPGSAPCNYDRMVGEIEQLRADGYLPIVTLQAIESNRYTPNSAQNSPNFRRLARAGAVIVNGSQSHWPQTMTFAGNNFVHYGLGNLFFDQTYRVEVTQGFIDRHVFYNGRFLGVELMTTLLEDHARPRPMTPEERAAFLQTIFSLSEWNEE